LYMSSHKRLRARSRLAKARSVQCGMSLMELMVGITIGLMVVLAAIGSLVFTQATSSVVGDSSRLQQKADSIFRNMGFHIAQAGAILVAPSSTDPSRIVFSTDYTGFDTATTGATAGQIFSIHGVNGASNGPDTLRVSYQDNMLSSDTAADKTKYGVRDCLGNRPTTNAHVDNQFSVSGTDLMCLGAKSTATAQSIADGVEDFQVTYGVQTIVANALQYRFYRADEIVDWSNIQAVNVCLQLTGENLGNPQPGLAMTGCRGQVIASDGLLRRVFSRTFSVRNALL
jgi:type IV pilus assembly protein PilW